MKNLIRLAVFLAFTMASYSFAGVKVVGNGGDAVICYTDAARSTIKSVQMFDYWEQPQVNNYGAIDLGGPQLSVQEKIQIAVSRISKFDPNLAQFINKNALNLANNISDYLVTKYILPDIQDMSPKVIPTQPNCYIEQFAIQYKDVQTGQKRFYISDLFYNHQSTSNDSKAGLLLHEAIYRFAILKQDAKNSDGVRFFNYTIATTAINSLRDTQLELYINLLKKSEIFDEKACVLKGPVLVENTGFYSSKICYNNVLTYGNIKMHVPANTELGNDYPLIFRLPQGWINNSKNPLFEIDINYSSGEILSFTTDNILITTFTSGQFIDVSVNTILAGNFPKMAGPLSKIYECLSFKMNVATNEMLECRHNDQSASFSYFKKINRGDRWLLGHDGILSTLKNNIKLPVLGSTKGLSYSLSNLPYSNLPQIYTEVDSNLNLVAGSTNVHPELQTPVEVNGFLYNITGFNIADSNNKFVLSATSAQKNFLNPKNRNLRLINSQDNYKADLFCALNGYKNGNINRYKNEYVSGKSEQFFDLSTNSVVYKVDEDVQVVESIFCDPVKIETDKY